jgi:hypothetical protein
VTALGSVGSSRLARVCAETTSRRRDWRLRRNRKAPHNLQQSCCWGYLVLRLLSWLTTGIVASLETMGYKFRRWSCKQCRYCGQPFYGPADHFACLPCFRDRGAAALPWRLNAGQHESSRRRDACLEPAIENH